MRPKGRIVAIVCSDLHLSLKPPAARSMEPNWLGAMAEMLDQLEELADRGGIRGQHDDYNTLLPIICAGDIFHYWKSEPELINFAIDHLPEMHAIPGQHDLPLHNFEDIHRSAYWTLVMAKKIKDIETDSQMLSCWANGIRLTAFPWGSEIKPCERKGKIEVALIHKYVWWGEHKYPTAPNDARLGKLQKVLSTYDACIFGDNHMGFVTSVGKNKTTVFNCGGFMRRASDEINYKPMVGLLHDTGLIEPHYLDISNEKMKRVTEPPKVEENEKVKEFIRSLERMTENPLDFRKALETFAETHFLGKDVKRHIAEALDND